MENIFSDSAAQFRSDSRQYLLFYQEPDGGLDSLPHEILFYQEGQGNMLSKKMVPNFNLQHLHLKGALLEGDVKYHSLRPESQ